MNVNTSSGQTAPSVGRRTRGPDEHVSFGSSLPFFIIQAIGFFGWIYTGFSTAAVIAALVLCFGRMLAITAFYHRYFSHKSFRILAEEGTFSRAALEFLFGCAAMTSVQRSPLWWLWWHRTHHQDADTPDDVHSPKDRGFWWAHIGWILCDKYNVVPPDRLSKLKEEFPSLAWSERGYAHVIPAVCLAVLCTWIGWAYGPELGTNASQMLVVGFFMSTAILFHLTSAVNSLAHMVGPKPEDAGCEARRCYILIPFTPEWPHDDHHKNPRYVQQGEGNLARYTDTTYWFIRLMQACGLVRINVERPSKAAASS